MTKRGDASGCVDIGDSTGNVPRTFSVVWCSLPNRQIYRSPDILFLSRPVLLCYVYSNNKTYGCVHVCIFSLFKFNGIRVKVKVSDSERKECVECIGITMMCACDVFFICTWTTIFYRKYYSDIYFTNGFWKFLSIWYNEVMMFWYSIKFS